MRPNEIRRPGARGGSVPHPPLGNLYTFPPHVESIRGGSVPPSPKDLPMELEARIAELERSLLERSEEADEARSAVDQWQEYTRTLEESKRAALAKNAEHEQHISSLMLQLAAARERQEAPQSVQSSAVSLREFHHQVEKEMAHVQVDLAELRQQLGRRDDVIQALRDDLRNAKERIHWFETELTLHRHRDRTTLASGYPPPQSNGPNYLMSPM